MPKWDKVSIAGTSKSLEWKLTDFPEVSKSPNFSRRAARFPAGELCLIYAVFRCNTSKLKALMVSTNMGQTKKSFLCVIDIFATKCPQSQKSQKSQ